MTPTPEATDLVRGAGILLETPNSCSCVPCSVPGAFALCRPSRVQSRSWWEEEESVS